MSLLGKLRGRLHGLLLVGAIGFMSPAALADANVDLGYSRSQTFSSALRYLRIDLGVEVTEKDADAAYLLFLYVPHGQKESTFGAVEIVDTGDGGIRLSVKLPRLASYHETVIRDALVKKLRQDYGSERAKKVPKKDTPKPKAPPEGAPPEEEKPPKSGEDAPES
jgi:hypothetical protein